MIYLLFLFAVLFGFSRGMKEGIVMIKRHDIMASNIEEGARSHVWFWFYHRLSVFVFAVFALGFGILIRMPFDIITTLICLFIVWEMYEIGYSVTRYWKLIPETEDLMIVRLWDRNVGYIHFGRVIVIIALIVGYMAGAT